jgi:hypothetical protein
MRIQSALEKSHNYNIEEAKEEVKKLKVTISLNESK